MKVIFIDSVHPILEERLLDLGCECADFTNSSREEILSVIHEYEGAVIRSKFKFNKEVFDLATKLKFIARSGAGMENIDTVYAQSKNVSCINSPEGNRDAVAEHALGMLLMLFNQLKNCDWEVRNGDWNRESNRGLEIKGKTIGIIGCGVMGQAFAQRLSGFDCKVIGYDKYNPDFSQKFIKKVSLEELQKQSDIVSLHFNYLEENHHLINSEYIDSFKKPFYLINTARGKSVKTKDLVEAIKSEKILGACLDVL